MQIEEGKALYLDRGYPSDVGEEVSLEAGLLPRPIRPVRRERYVPWLQYLAITSRRVVETVGSMLNGLFPRRIHAVTPEGFMLKVLSFVLAHNWILLAKEIV